MFGYDDNTGLNEYIRRNLKSNNFTKIDAGAGVIAPAAASNYNIPRSVEKVSAKLLICSNIG